MIWTPTNSTTHSSSDSRTRVLVVDDSAVIRSLVARTFIEEKSIKIAGSLGDGQQALDFIKKNPVDIIILDIEMPVMDGLTALPKILKVDPKVKVIMSSTLTLRNADISIKALRLGATDYVAKPSTTQKVISSQDFHRELLDKVMGLAAAKRRDAPTNRYAPNQAVLNAQNPIKAAPGVLRSLTTVQPEIIGIGSSTGGPQALFKLLSNCQGSFKQPILITQHMPPTFTTILADHLTKASGCPVHEAKQGMVIEGGHIYIAPGDYHMTLKPCGKSYQIELNREPHENFCRPSVDPMFRSIASHFGPKAIGVILTGMGQDGLEGSRKIVDSGGAIIAQDEATSVVWGMPGAVSNAGLCSAVSPLDELTLLLRRVASNSKASTFSKGDTP